MKLYLCEVVHDYEISTRLIAAKDENEAKSIVGGVFSDIEEVTLTDNNFRVIYEVYPIPQPCNDVLINTEERKLFDQVFERYDYQRLNKFINNIELTSTYIDVQNIIRDSLGSDFNPIYVLDSLSRLYHDELYPEIARSFLKKKLLTVFTGDRWIVIYLETMEIVYMLKHIPPSI